MSGVPGLAIFTSAKAWLSLHGPGFRFSLQLQRKDQKVNGPYWPYVSKRTMHQKPILPVVEREKGVSQPDEKWDPWEKQTIFDGKPPSVRNNP